jgi:drug/metabolite transporter (DMT)-like permease
MRLSLWNIGLVLAYAVMMAVGQIAFKYLALLVKSGPSASLFAAFVALILNPVFWVVGFIYVAMTFYWVWVLTIVPLSIAYPLSSVALVIVPCLSWFLFSERLDLQYWIGVAMIVGGVVLVTR